MDYPLCALGRGGWWRGDRTCFHTGILTKTGTERGTTHIGDQSTRPSLFIFDRSPPPLYFALFLKFPPRVCWRGEKCSQNCCASPWLWSSMSTRWEPISATMTGTSDEWMPTPCSEFRIGTLFLCVYSWVSVKQWLQLVCEIWSSPSPSVKP